MLQSRRAVSVSRGVALPIVKEFHPDLKTREHRLWAAEVIRRADGKCQGKDHQGNRYGHKLEADHILERQDRPDLKLDINNGQALCRSCHARKTEQEKRRRNSRFA